MSELENYIRGYFGLEKVDVSEISNLFKEKVVPKDGFFCKENERCNKLAFVKSGAFRISALTEKKEVTQWISTSGEFITDISSLLFQTNLDDMTFKPKILAVKTNTELVWIGRLLLPGIFDGKHRFEIIDNHNGTCTFSQSERFRGILVPFMRKKIKTEVKGKFQEMNEALKRRVETN